MSATDVDLGIGPGIGPAIAPTLAGEGGLALLAGERWQAVSARDRRFFMALAATAFFHAALVIGITRAVPRQMGDPSGADNAISIAIVTEADLKSLSSVPEEGGLPPGAPASSPTPPVPPEPQVKPDQPETLRQSITEDAPKPKSEPQPELQPDTKHFSIPEPNPAPAPAKKPVAKVQPPSPPKPKQSAKLDLTPPGLSSNAPFGGGGSAGFERPPGITRSGANDAFGYEVVKALRKSMPPHSGRFGRVKVRFFLDLNGNVTDVQIVQPSKIAEIDQEVVFAVRQTTFPFPPPKSVPADRTFQITYIYN